MPSNPRDDRPSSTTSSPQTVYLHIGPPKTATTYLQDVLWGCRDELAAQGVTFAGRHFSDHFFAALDIRDVKFGQYDHPRRSGAWKRLADSVASATTPATIISHEMFAAATEEQIATIVADLAPADVHVVYALRDIGRQLPAVWQEGVKNRWTLGWDDFCHTMLRTNERRGLFWMAQDAPEVLARWATAVPRENVHVVTMPPSGAPTDLFWQRFCSVIGVDPEAFDLTKARPNASLSLDQVELLRRINLRLDDEPRRLPWPDYQSFIKARFSAVANAGGGSRRVKVTAELADDTRRHAHRIVDGLRTAGYSVTGDLDEALPADSAFGDDNEVSDGSLASEAIELFVATAKQQAQVRRRRSKGAGRGKKPARRSRLSRLKGRVVSPLRRR